MNQKHIVLVGMPGSGKSTLGFHLSMLLGIPFVDTDNYIVTKFKKSVNTIFKDDGETAFRKMENDALKEILQNAPAVISTGGGLPCFHNNMEIIVQNSISVYLKVDTEILAGYLKNDKKRPLLKNKTEQELLEYVELLLENRKDYYEKADITIKTHNDNPTQLAVKLISLLEANP